MVDRSFHGFKSDFEDKGDPVYVRHVNRSLGIDVSYPQFDDRTYTRDFASAKEAVDYLERHPPAYSRDDKKSFLDTLDKYSTLSYNHFKNSKFDKATEEEVEKSIAPDQSKKSTISYQIPFTMGLSELPGEVADDPFYFIQKVEDVLLKKSKIIKEIMFAFKPMIIPRPDSRYKITGEFLDVLLREIGVFVTEKSIADTNDIWVLHCKMDDVENTLDEKMDGEVTEMDRRQAEFQAASLSKFTRNSHDIPILREATKELNIDYNDPESIESYVQEDMGLRIILKEINRNKDRKDNDLLKRIFIFNCFFFI